MTSKAKTHLPGFCKKGRIPRIIYNDDTISLRQVRPPHTDRDVARPVDYLEGTQVDTLAWCVFDGDVAWSWPSKVCDNVFDLSRKKTLVGFDPSRDVMLTLHRKGVDYLPMLIEETRHRAMRFFASFRMNDAHHRCEPDSILVSDFWREHQDYRLWEVTDGLLYYNATLDYSYPQVRQRRLAAIREFVTWYDVDGIELDFCRNPYLFPPSQAWSKRGILTTFIKRVNNLLGKIGKMRGRKIDLMIRVPFMENKRIQAGMDVSEWLRHRYVDVLVMSGLSNNYNQTIEPWASSCRKRGILFYPSVEAGPMTNAPAHNHVVPQTINEAQRRHRACAQAFLAQGAEGIYMFNHPCQLFDPQRKASEFKKLTTVLSEMGTAKTLAGTKKQYTFWQELPIIVETGRPARYYQTIRFNLFEPDLRRRNRTVTVTFRQVACRNPHARGRYEQNPIVPRNWITYLLNGRPVESPRIKRSRQPAGPIPSGFKLDRHQKIRFCVPGSRLTLGQNTLAFHIDRFPQPRDPFIYIYELLVDINTQRK